MVSTSDSDSDNLSSNLGRTFIIVPWYLLFYMLHLETNQLLQRLTVSGKNLVTLLNTAPSEVRTHDLEIMRLARCLLRYRGMYVYSTHSIEKQSYDTVNSLLPK